MFDQRPAQEPGHRSSGPNSTGRRWLGRPLLTFGVPALLAAFGGIVLTSQAALAGQDTSEVTCTLTVPADPLSAKGLARAYHLEAPCHEADAGSAAFVQATIVDPATGAVSVYNPLVIDAGARPAAPPAAPKLPAGAVVGLWFGFNGDNLRLADDHGSLAAGKCVNGRHDSIFGQFAYCDAPAVFTAANAAIAAGKLTVPGLGTSADGRPCPTTRDFGLVDMDQSDNVTTTYLVLADGTTAQNTAANRATLARRGARIAVNGSDNALLDAHVFPALGCTPYRAPDLGDAGAPATSLALNELQAAGHQAAPVALVPTSDPMTKLAGKPSVAKTDLYRAGVGQPPIDAATETPKAYCGSLLRVGADRIELDRSLTVRAASPDPAAANSLFTFLAQRFSGAYDELDCPRLLHTKNPVKVTTNAKGVVVSARFAGPPRPPAAPSVSPTRPASAAATRPPGHSTPPTTVQSTLPPQPASGATHSTHTVQTGQAGPPTNTGIQPATTATQPATTATQPATTATTSDPPSAGDAPADDAPAGNAPPVDNVNLPGPAVDAMRLKAPASKTTLTGASTAATAVGMILLAVGIAGFFRAARRNRGRDFPGPAVTEDVRPW